MPRASSLAVDGTVVPAASGPSVAGRRGANVTYDLSETAEMGFTVERPSPGRQAGNRCARPGKRNRKARRCTRWVRLRGGFAHPGQAGFNRFRFTGRLRNRKLARGRYRLLATPTAGGRRGATRRAGFRIIR